MTRRSLAWIDFGISASSSRNNVPPCAASSRPGLSRTAPVNAPLRCPNISDSSSPSGSAAQLMAMDGRLERRLWWRRYRARLDGARLWWRRYRARLDGARLVWGGGWARGGGGSGGGGGG